MRPWPRARQPTSPRQPACATPTRVPARSANTHRQAVGGHDGADAARRRKPRRHRRAAAAHRLRQPRRVHRDTSRAPARARPARPASLPQPATARGCPDTWPARRRRVRRGSAGVRARADAAAAQRRRAHAPAPAPPSRASTRNRAATRGPDSCLGGGEVRRQHREQVRMSGGSGACLERLAGHRVLELQPRRVQRLPRKPRSAARSSSRRALAAARRRPP